MKPQTALRTSLLLLLLPATAAVALPQEPPRPGSAHQGRAESPPHVGGLPKSWLRARAAVLATSTADEAQGWSDRKAAVRVLSEAADLMWDEGPDRARSWLKRAWELAGELSDKAGDGGVSRYRSSSAKRSARGLVLVVAQRRDGALAEHFLGQLIDEQEKTGRERGRGIFDDKSARSEQLLNLALSVVRSDPAAAMRLAELSLADGVSFRFQSVLLALREQDKSMADRLFDLAMARLTARHYDLSEAQVIGSYLFTPGRVAGVGGGSSTAMAVSASRSAVGLTPAEADPERARRFLNVVQQTLLTSPAPSTAAAPAARARELVTLAGSLEESFRLYAPDLWTPVAQRVTAVLPDVASGEAGLPQSVREGRGLGGSVTVRGEGEGLYVEALKEAAEKEADPVARKFAYARAALATTPDDLPRGLSLAGGISDESLRKHVSSVLTYRAALAATEQGQFDKAAGLAAGLEPRQRALVCIAAARQLSARPAGEDEVQAALRKGRSIELLLDAEKALKEHAVSGEALRVRLWLAAALAPLDAARALDILRDVVLNINRDESFDPDDVSVPVAGRVYGLPVQASEPTLRGGLGLKDAFSALSKVDFEETVYIAGKLKAAPARGICMLEIARSVLAGDESKR